MHRVLVGIVVVLALATTAAMALLASRPAPAERDALPPLVDGTVLDVTPVPTDPSAPEAQFLPPGALEVDLRVSLEGSDEGVLIESVVDETGSTYQAGQRVRLEPAQGDGQTLYSVVDFRRDRPLAILAALFVLAVVAFGRFQGVRALVGLALSAVVVVAFLVPAIVAGQDPVVVALTAAAAIMILTLYLTHGPSEKTTAAVVGTALALLLTGGLALLFIQFADLTGLSSEEAGYASSIAGGLSLQGLLLAGIVLGALGVLDDVTVSQSSLVFELARADPRASFARLFRRGLRVGRDHVAATVNTLFLAYAGASLPLLILFATGSDPVTTVVTSELVAVEVVRTIVGSLGLIAAVPLTTALAAALAIGQREGEGEVERLPSLLLPERQPMAVAVGQHEPVVSASRGRGAVAETRPRDRQHLRSVDPPEQERHEPPAAWRVPPGRPAEPDEPPQPPVAWRVPSGDLAEPPERSPREPDRESPPSVDEPLPSRRTRAQQQQGQSPAVPGRLRRRGRGAQPPAGRPPRPADAPPALPGGQLELPPPAAEEPAPPVEPAEPADPPPRRSGRGASRAEPEEDTPKPRRLGRGQRRTAAQAEQEQLEDWFRQLRNPYGRPDDE